MPSVKELEAEMEKEIQELKKLSEKKLEQIKAMMRGLNQSPVQEKRNPTHIEKIFNKVELPLRHGIWQSLTEISKEFEGIEMMLYVGHEGYQSEAGLYEWLNKHGETHEFRIEIMLNGCKPAGTKAFNIRKEIILQTNT